MTADVSARAVPGEGGCLLWTGATTNGYGVVSVDGRLQRAHRVAYEQANGPIPAGLHLDHLCRVRACINPDHLEPVTQAENNRRAGAAKTTCSKGHENYRLHPDGRKYCATCRSDYDRARYAAQGRRAS